VLLSAGFFHQVTVDAALVDPEWIEEFHLGGGLGDADGGADCAADGSILSDTSIGADVIHAETSLEFGDDATVSTASLAAFQSALGVGGTSVVDLTSAAADDLVKYSTGTSKMVIVNNTATAVLENGANVPFLDQAETVVGNWDNTANPWSIDEGGTGAATATAARTALDVQQLDTDLTDLADGTLSKSKVEDSTEWDSAYTDRLKWDGGATGLVAATALTSLGAGDLAVQDTIDLVSDVIGTLPAAMVGTGLTDAQVSNVLTASVFIGSGSTSDAVDLGTAEVTGTLGIDNLLIAGDFVIDGSFAFDAVSAPDFEYDSKWSDDASDVDYYDGELYTVTDAARKVQVLDLDGAQDREWAISGAGTQYYIHVTATPEVYVSDFDNDVVNVYTITGTLSRSFGSNGTGDGEFDGVARLVEDSSYLWVCDYTNNRIQKLTTAGVYVTEIDLSVGGVCWSAIKPTGIDLYNAKVYVTGDTLSGLDHSIWIYSSSTLAYDTKYGFETLLFSAVEVFDGYLFALKSSGHLMAYDIDTGIAIADSGSTPGAGDGHLVAPDGIAFHGNDVWIAEETDNARIQEWDIYTDTTVTVINSKAYGGVVFSVEGDLYAQEDNTAADDVIAGDDVVAGGLVSVVETVTAGTGITATTGAITATAGAVVAGTTVTAGTGVIASAGGVTADAGDIEATLGNVVAQINVTATAGDITADAGDITATAGAISAGTTVTAGTGVTATAGDITADAGDITATAGDLVATAGDLVATAGNVSAGDDVIAADDITVGGKVDITGAVRLVAGSDTVTAGSTISHGGSGLVLIASAAPVTTDTTTAIAAGADMGQELRIINGDDYAITIKDSAGTSLGGADIVLGTSDVLDLMWTGFDWLKTGHEDN